VSETTIENEAEFATDEATGISYTSESAPSADAPARPATIAPAGATGRRKESVARVRIVPGSGNWNINGKDLAGYFPNKVHQQIVSEPFALTGVTDRFDVIARIHGGGTTGQAGALRLGVARCLNEIDVEANRPVLKGAGRLASTSISLRQRATPSRSAPA